MKSFLTTRKLIKSKMSSQQVNISYEPSSIVSKFGKQEKVVYIIPTIDECLALLPRHLGNYILSYTNAFLLFYIDNLVRKYGIAFVCEVFRADIFRFINFKIITTQTIQQRLERYIKYSTKHNTPRDKIVSAFERGIITRQSLIEAKKQQQILASSIKKSYLEILNVGSIITSYVGTFLVVEKTKLCYYTAKVSFQDNNPVYNTLTSKSFSVDIKRNVNFSGFSNVDIVEAKPLKIIKWNNSVVLPPVLTNNHKREYVMGLFGYKKLKPSEYIKNYDLPH